MSNAENSIYPTESAAAEIAAILTSESGQEHIVYKVTTGHQVVPIQKVPEYMPPSKPAPVPAAIKTVSTTTSNGSSAGKPASAKLHSFTFKLKSDSKSYIGVELQNGAVTYFGKSTLVDWTVLNGEVTLTMTTAVAKKRKLL